LAGKEVVIKGVGKMVTTSVDDQKHYLKDANATQAEIDAITQPKTELVFEATGVYAK